LSSVALYEIAGKESSPKFVEPRARRSGRRYRCYRFRQSPGGPIKGPVSASVR